MRLDQMNLKWSPLRNIIIAKAKSNRIHQRETGYKYNWSKWGLYKQTKLRIIYNDYVYAIYSMANPQHQMCSIELWAACSMHLREFQYRCTHATVLCVVDRADKQAAGWRWMNTTASDYWHNSGSKRCFMLQETRLVGRSTENWSPLLFYTAHTHTHRQHGTELCLFLY